MKRYILPGVMLVFLLSSCKKNNDIIKDYVSMGLNSTNDVYYSFANGQVKSALRSDWDIAFSVPLQTAAILINEGAGVELYCVGDTNAWDSANASSLLSHKPMYNNKSDWSDGAFNINASGGFNFGWGTYNMVTHSVYGDSVFIIKLVNGSYKKLLIKNRIGIPDTYVLRWANLDGTELVNTTFSASAYYNKKNFIQYSIVNQKIVEAEPDMNSWDLLFTRYIVKIPISPESFLYYSVTGVLINPLETAVKVTGVDPEVANYTDTTASFTSQADVIGWDWKTNDSETHLYSIVPNVSYFVKLTDGSIYRIYFKEFTGITEGSITFNSKKIE
jgi:hypothetical protein